MYVLFLVFCCLVFVAWLCFGGFVLGLLFSSVGGLGISWWGFGLGLNGLLWCGRIVGLYVC